MVKARRKSEGLCAVRSFSRTRMGNCCDHDGDGSGDEGHAPRRSDESERLLSRAPAMNPLETLTYIVRECGGTHPSLFFATA